MVGMVGRVGRVNRGWGCGRSSRRDRGHSDRKKCLEGGVGRGGMVGGGSGGGGEAPPLMYLEGCLVHTRERWHDLKSTSLHFLLSFPSRSLTHPSIFLAIQQRSPFFFAPSVPGPQLSHHSFLQAALPNTPPSFPNPLPHPSPQLSAPLAHSLPHFSARTFFPSLPNRLPEARRIRLVKAFVVELGALFEW